MENQQSSEHVGPKSTSSTDCSAMALVTKHCFHVGGFERFTLRQQRARILKLAALYIPGIAQATKPSFWEESPQDCYGTTRVKGCGSTIMYW